MSSFCTPSSAAFGGVVVVGRSGCVSSLRCGPRRTVPPPPPNLADSEDSDSWSGTLLGVADLDDLRAKFNASDRAPFLFVGAGLSRRYLKLDGWIDLLNRMASLTRHPYAYYATKANNSLPGIASLISSEFHEIWWTDPKFEESRKQYSETLHTSDGPLKVEVAKYTRSSSAVLPSKGTVEHEELLLLANAAIDGLITTNYDSLLEFTFPDFHTYVGQDQLLFSGTQGIAEIYKIHGSESDPESMIITSADYERFGERNPYLAAKLLTIFVEHPVLFLGYSLNDQNVTDILTSVARVLTTDNLTRLQDHLIFVNWKASSLGPNLVSTQIAASGFTIPVLQLTVSDFRELFALLGEVPRKFPAQMLRQLKKHVYELVAATDPAPQLAVIDIDDSTASKDIDVVFGVGVRHQLAERGYQGLTRRDLLIDVLSKDSQFDAVRIVREALPAIFRGPGYTPIYRYLRGSNLLTKDGKLLANADVDPKIANRVATSSVDLQPAGQQLRRAERLVTDAGGSLVNLLTASTLPEALLGVLVLPKPLDPELLRGYLLDNAAALDTPATASAWAKAVYMYDFTTFSRAPSKSPASKAP